MFPPGRGLNFIFLSEWSYVHARFFNKRCDFFFQFKLQPPRIHFLAWLPFLRQCVGGCHVVLHSVEASSHFFIIVLRCPTKERCVDEKLPCSSKLRT